MASSLVYVVRNMSNGMMYIGRGNSKRVAGYPSAARNHLRRAIELYGWKRFSVTVIECGTKAASIALEVFLIAESGGPDGGRLYNLTWGGEDGCVGKEGRAKQVAYARSAKHRALVAASNRKRKVSTEHKARTSASLRKYPDEIAAIWQAMRENGWTFEDIGNEVNPPVPRGSVSNAIAAHGARA